MDLIFLPSLSSLVQIFCFFLFFMWAVSRAIVINGIAKRCPHRGSKLWSLNRQNQETTIHIKPTTWTVFIASQSSAGWQQSKKQVHMQALEQWACPDWMQNTFQQDLSVRSHSFLGIMLVILIWGCESWTHWASRETTFLTRPSQRSQFHNGGATGLIHTTIQCPKWMSCHIEAPKMVYNWVIKSIREML